MSFVSVVLDRGKMILTWRKGAWGNEDGNHCYG